METHLNWEQNTQKEWEISNKKAVILKQDEKTMKLAIVWGKSGSFDILYKREGFDDIVLPIEIKSL